MPFTEEQLRDIFTYHSPTPEQQAHYLALRDAAFEFSKVIITHTPPSADQTASIRKLREVVMTLNASIALQGKF